MQNKKKYYFIGSCTYLFFKHFYFYCTTISPCFIPIEVHTTGYVPGVACRTFIENVSHALIDHDSDQIFGTVAENIQPTPSRDGVTWISYDFHAESIIFSGTKDLQLCPTETTSIVQLLRVQAVFSVTSCATQESFHMVPRTIIELITINHHTNNNTSFFMRNII